MTVSDNKPASPLLTLLLESGPSVNGGAGGPASPGGASSQAPEADEEGFITVGKATAAQVRHTNAIDKDSYNHCTPEAAS